MRIPAQTKGMTLLEVMLVLVIAAVLVTMGVKFYYRSRIQEDYLQIQYNVDVLLQSLRQFYQSNCQSGVLSPLHTPPADLTQPFTIESAAEFQTYLMSPANPVFLQANWPIYNAEVDTSYGYQGYLVKFNPRVINGGYFAKACYDYIATPQRICYGGVVEGSTIVLWEVEVSVKILDPDHAEDFSMYTGRNCVVSNVPTNRAVNCTTDADPVGNILVWQRLPSAISPELKAGLWMMTPYNKGFNLLYSHDVMYELSNPNAASPGGGSSYKYYLCGG